MDPKQKPVVLRTVGGFDKTIHDYVELVAILDEVEVTFRVLDGTIVFADFDILDAQPSDKELDPKWHGSDGSKAAQYNFYPEFFTTMIKNWENLIPIFEAVRFSLK